MILKDDIIFAGTFFHMNVSYKVLKKSLSFTSIRLIPSMQMVDYTNILLSVFTEDKLPTVTHTYV